MFRRRPDPVHGVLSPAERSLYAAEKRIIVTGSAGTRFEVLTNSYMGNIFTLDEHGCWIDCWCCHPQIQFPLENYLPNLWAGQILAIKADEERFLEIACYQNTRRCRELPPLPVRDGFRACPCGIEGCVEVVVGSGSPHPTLSFTITRAAFR